MRTIKLKLKNIGLDEMAILDANQMKQVYGGTDWTTVDDGGGTITTYANCAGQSVSSCAGECEKGGGSYGTCGKQGLQSTSCTCN